MTLPMNTFKCVRAEVNDTTSGQCEYSDDSSPNTFNNAIIIIIIFVYYDCSQTAQSYRTIATQGGKLQPPRRAALGLYTDGLSTAILLPHYGAQRLINRTGLTSWAFTRWRDQPTFDKVVHYSIYRPQKDERLSWPSWLTYSGRLTHISGHPSAAGRAWNRECSPIKDRRSATVQRN